MVPQKINVDLTEYELNKFQKFFDAHLLCKDDVDILTLSTMYSIKLVFNFSNSKVIKTCICSICGDETLITDLSKEQE